MRFIKNIINSGESVKGFVTGQPIGHINALVSSAKKMGSNDYEK